MLKILKKIAILLQIFAVIICLYTLSVVGVSNNNKQSTAMAMNGQPYSPAVTSKVKEIAKANWKKTEKSIMAEKTLNTTNEPNCVAFLPEGFTGDTFIEYLSIQNPNDDYVYVEVIFMTKDGSYLGAEKSMAPESRWSICVNDIIPGEEVSTMILADDLVLPERAMYMDEWEMYGATNSIGYVYYFPDELLEE